MGTSLHGDTAASSSGYAACLACGFPQPAGIVDVRDQSLPPPGGLSREGAPYYFAKNNIELTDTQIHDAGKQVAEGDHRGNESCGACWSPDGRTLFVNIQTLGITFAITGPWVHGSL